MKHNEQSVIDWQSCCNNLRRVKPLTQIAKEIGMEEKTINRLARGETREPSFTNGIRLLDMHFDLCPERHDKLIR